MDKASIIVPIYNAEKYLSQCIESLINQTYKNLEIILINDGSTDNSLNICKKYAQKDDRIVIHSIKNSGVSVARNKGISISTGKYITFVDSDDWIEPNMLEFAIHKSNVTESDIVIWSYFKNYYNNEIRLSLLPGGDQTFKENKDILYLKSIYSMIGEDKVTDSVSAGTVWCKLYTRKFINKNSLEFNPVLTRSQDTIFSINAFSKANKISFFDKSLYHYRINNSSTCSGNRFIKDTKKPFNTLLDQFKIFIKNYGSDNKYYDAFNARTIQVLLWHLEHYYFHDRYQKGILNRRKEIVNLIKSEPYKTALQNVETGFLPKKEKVMTMLLKRKLVLTFYLIYTLHGKVERFRNRRYE